jgi:phenylacetate-coenzyme A ligase PaaK-like adenylate-forming protein
MLIPHAHLSWSATPPEVWQAWQLRRLRDYLAHRVLPFSAHYRKIFAEQDLHPHDLRSLEDWTLAPFTTKAELTVPREKQREFVLIPDPSALRREWKTIRHAVMHGRAYAQEQLEKEFRPVLLTSTTGRSSDPVPFVFTKHDIANLELQGRRIMEAGRSQKDFRHVNAFPFAPHLAFWQAHYAGIGFGTFMVSTGGGKSLGTEGNLNLIEKIQPDVIIGMPTFIYHLLREAVETGRHWPNIKRVVLGGEKVAEGLRARLLSLTAELGSSNVCILSTYGFTEAKLAFPECASESGATTGFHLSPDLGIVELVDPVTGGPVPEGEPGEIVFTPLDARGTVVLRYRTGDIAEGGMTWKRCPHCGRTSPRLIGPISRVSEVRELHLDKVKGSLVNFNILEHLLDDQKGIAAWQIELNKRDGDPLEVDEVLLHVTPENGVEAADLEHRIARRFAEVCEIKPNKILFHEMPEMRERLGVGRLLKEQKLLDLRQKPQASLSKR